MSIQAPAAYNEVPSVSTHDWVNHSVNFVSPSGTHTQNIESYWNRVKIKLKRMRGCHEHQLTSYLDEFMYRERYGQTARQLFEAIIRDIANQYPVTEPSETSAPSTSSFFSELQPVLFRATTSSFQSYNQFFSELPKCTKFLNHKFMYKIM